MNSRPIVRTVPMDTERTRDALRRNVGSFHTYGDHRIHVTPEPLLRRTADGGLEQAIRVETGVAVTVADISIGGKPAARTHLEPVMHGARLFIEEVDTDTTVTLTFPELSGGSDADSSVMFTVGPQRHWRMHLVHHSHFDVGYTDPQSRVIAEQLSYLDTALHLAESSDSDDESRFRWCVESLWTFDQWAAHRPEATIARFLEQVRRGNIEITAMPFNLHTETCSTDELHELLSIANTVKERYGIEIPAAMQTDVPGAVAGLVDALTENGVRFLSVAHNWAGRSVPGATGGHQRPRLFWWESPSGARILVWVTDSPHGLAYMEGPMVGFHESYAAVDDLLPSYLASLAQNPYPYDGNAYGFVGSDADGFIDRAPYRGDLLHFRVQGRLGDNAPPRRVVSDIVQQWNERWAFPQLRLSRNEDFFEEAERRYGDDIPTLVGDWNDWWSDGIGSGARPMQLVREAQALVADAQTIEALANLRAAPPLPFNAEPVYRSIALFDEHTWGASNPWTHGDEAGSSGEEQWHWKYSQALAANASAKSLMDQAKRHVGDALGKAEDAAVSAYVLNPTETPRDGVVRVFVSEAQVSTDTSITVLDSRDGTALSYQGVQQTNPNHRDAGRFLDVLVRGVPPLGAVRIDILTREGGPEDETTSDGNEPTLENDQLKVTIDLITASIGSIVDKASGRELVGQRSAFGFNAYVHDDYGSLGGSNHLSGHIEADPRSLSMLTKRSLARPAVIVERGSSRVRDWITYQTTGDAGEVIASTLTLEPGSARLDIENRVQKPAQSRKESAYFAFPFSFEEPTVRFDISGSVAGDDIAYVPGSAPHARAVRRWVSLQQDGIGAAWVTQDAPLVQRGDIVIPYAPFPTTLPERESGTIFSWIHNNIWDTNFPIEQSFDMTFRYSVSSGPAAGPNAASTNAARTALARSRPLRAALAFGAAATAAPAELAPITLETGSVTLVGLVPMPTGDMLVRLQSTTTESATVTIRSSATIDRAVRATYLGQPLEELSSIEGGVQLTVPGMSTAACLLQFGAS